MPLNYKENGTKPQPQSRGPVLHQPGDGDKKSSKLMIVLLVVVVVAAAAFFVFKYDLVKRNSSAQQTPVAQPEKSIIAAPDTASHAVQVPPADTSPRTPVDSTKGGAVDTAPHNAAGLKRPPAELAAGSYTIYISRHKTKEVADSEAGTWRDAGYEANVSEADGWYRLAIGRYKTWDEAKATAEKLRDGLEAGYKIGKIDE